MEILCEPVAVSVANEAAYIFAVKMNRHWRFLREDRCFDASRKTCRKYGMTERDRERRLSVPNILH